MAGPVTCRACGAAVVWARTGAGKLMPVDATPTADGNVELIASDMAGGRAVKVWGTSHRWPAGQLRYTSHFATCPAAAEFRRL